MTDKKKIKKVVVVVRVTTTTTYEDGSSRKTVQVYKQPTAAERKLIELAKERATSQNEPNVE